MFCHDPIMPWRKSRPCKDGRRLDEPGVGYLETSTHSTSAVEKSPFRATLFITLCSEDERTIGSDDAIRAWIARQLEFIHTSTNKQSIDNSSML